MKSVMWRLVVVSACVMGSTQAWSQEAEVVAQGRSLVERIAIDVEVDPLAYVLGGHSLHVGVGYEGWRLDLGNFAMELPEWFHGQQGYSPAFRGFGAKLDRFIGGEQSGAFVGVEASYTVMDVLDVRTGQAARSPGLTAGGRVGWRIMLPGDFFIAPWVGVGYRFGDEVIGVGEASYEQSAWVIFPTIHIGYRAR
jgi:hypothetical protein